MRNMNPEAPRPRIRSTRGFSSSIRSFFILRIALSPVRNFIIQMAERVWEIIVARAAPCTPIWNRNINTGSRIRFATAPMMTVIMPIPANPWALMNIFMPRPIITETLPSI